MAEKESKEGETGEAAEEGKKKSPNNLTDMKPTDEVYLLEGKRILREIKDKDLQAILDSAPQLGLVAADVFYSFYAVAPNLVPRNGDPLLEAVRKKMLEYMQTDAYKELRKTSELNEEESLFYTAAFMKNLLKMLQQQMQQEGQGQGQPQPGQGNGKPQSYQQTLQDAQNGDESAKKKIEALLNKVLSKQGRKELKKMVGDSFELASKDDGGGMSRTPQQISPLSVEDTRQVIRLSKFLIDNIPQPVSTKVPSPHGDLIAGYRLTRNPAKALRKEFAFPDDVFAARWSQGLLAFEKLTTSQGAYYVLMDKSGSMAQKEKLIWSRSVALALFSQASKEGKKFFLRFFDGDTYPLLEKPKDVVAALLNTNSDGSTKIDDALAVAVVDIMKNKKFHKKTSTIILITDGEDTLVRDWPQELKAAGANIVAIMINGDNPTIKRIAEPLYFSVTPTADDALKIMKELRRKEDKDKKKSKN